MVYRKGSGHISFFPSGWYPAWFFGPRVPSRPLTWNFWGHLQRLGGQECGTLCTSLAVWCVHLWTYSPFNWSNIGGNSLEKHWWNFSGPLMMGLPPTIDPCSKHPYRIHMERWWGPGGRISNKSMPSPTGTAKGDSQSHELRWVGRSASLAWRKTRPDWVWFWWFRMVCKGYQYVMVFDGY